MTSNRKCIFYKTFYSYNQNFFPYIFYWLSAYSMNFLVCFLIILQLEVEAFSIDILFMYFVRCESHNLTV